MLIRAGYEITYDCTQPTPMLLALSVHPSRLPDVEGEHRIRFQAAIGRQLRLRGTPQLSFEPDPAIALGSRVEELLRDLHRNEDDGS